MLNRISVSLCSAQGITHRKQLVLLPRKFSHTSTNSCVPHCILFQFSNNTLRLLNKTLCFQSQSLPLEKQRLATWMGTISNTLSAHVLSDVAFRPSMLHSKCWMPLDWKIIIKWNRSHYFIYSPKVVFFNVFPLLYRKNKLTVNSKHFLHVKFASNFFKTTYTLDPLSRDISWHF